MSLKNRTVFPKFHNTFGKHHKRFKSSTKFQKRKRKQKQIQANLTASPATPGQRPDRRPTTTLAPWPLAAVVPAPVTLTAQPLSATLPARRPPSCWLAARRRTCSPMAATASEELVDGEHVGKLL